MSNSDLVPERKGRGGPATPEGKAIARLNATKHGVLSNIVPEHEAPAYAEHVARVRAHYQPDGYLEELLTERVASTLWRLTRVVRYESALVQEHVDAAMQRDGWGELRQALTDLWELLQDDADPSLNAWAEDAVQSLQTAVGSASLPNEIVDKVPRYEAHLDRTLQRAITQLKELKHMKNEFVSQNAPLAGAGASQGKGHA